MTMQRASNVAFKRKSTPKIPFEVPSKHDLGFARDFRKSCAQDMAPLEEVMANLYGLGNLIQDTLSIYGVGLAQTSQIPDCQNRSNRASEQLLTMAMDEYRRIQIRDDLDNGELFINAPWRMLVDLYICGMKHTPVSITDLIIAGGVPQTTGLRYVNLLVDLGFISKNGNPFDSRVTHLKLTPQGIGMINRYLEAIE